MLNIRRSRAFALSPIRVRPRVWFGYALLAGTMFSVRSHAVSAQETPVVQPGTDGVSLNFQNTDLSVVVAMLADLAGLTVSYSGLPSVPVTLRSAGPVPRSQLRQILQSIVESNGLTIVEEGGVVRIEGRAEQLVSPAFDPSGTGAFQSGTMLFSYALKHAQSEPVAATIRELFGLGGGTAAFLGGPGARPRGLAEERLPRPLDAPDQMLPDGSTTVAQNQVGVLQGEVQIVPYPPNNSIMIRAAQADYDAIRSAIDQLDTRPLQVLIEAVIIEVQRDRQFELGIDLEVPDQTDAQTGVTIGGGLQGSSTGDVVLRLLGAGGVDADIVISALAARSDVSVLSRPLVLTQNNQEARILVGAQRPFVQLSRSLPTDAAVRDQVVQYRDVGTQLTIRPTINPDGYVTLNVLQEISNATAETQFGAPVISTREAATQLFVKDGHTAVIGGLIDRLRERANSGIPFLKDIPLLGHLFRSTRRRNTTTELFILLTPHVVAVDEDLIDIQRQLTEKSRVLRGSGRDLAPLIEADSTIQEQ